MSAADLLIAFAEFYGSRRSHVAICKHGGKPGYVHVVPAGFDPAKLKDRHIAVELYNGTVAVSDDLKTVLGGAVARPNVRIENDPLGYSAGPNYGRFGWALTFQQIVQWKDGPAGFVRDVNRHLSELHATDGPSSDYDADAE